MSISSEIQKLQTNLSNSYEVCSDKGATMPASQNFDNLADCIDSIPSESVVDRYFISNIIKRGSLSDDNGLLSNFSNDNYGIIDLIPTNVTSFEFNLDFTSGSDATSSYEEAIIGNSSGNRTTPQIEIGDGLFRMLCSADGSSWTASITCNISNNTHYTAKLLWDGTTISGYIKDDGGNITNLTVETSNSLTSLYWVNNAAVGWDGSGTFWKGSINLNNCSLKINGQEVWTGVINQTPTKEYLISNVKKVGSVLDNKGILSGFSTTNYVKLPFNIPTSSVNSWEVVIPFHYSRAGTENQVLLGYPEAGSARYKSPQIYLTGGGRIELSLSSSGTSWDVLPSTASTNTMELNKDYIVKLSFSGTEYKLEVSKDGYNFTTWISTQSSTKMYGFYNTSLGTGGGGSAILPTNGSINLNGCSIKVDNETVWQGKVNQMPADKYYALAPNYEVIGSPTIYNFVASSFSTSSYIRSSVSTPSSGNFEINTMFTMPNTAFTADAPIISKASGTSGDLFINSSSQKIGSWNNSIGVEGSTILEVGKTYSVKLVSDTVTSVYLKEGEPSSDLNDYTLEYTDYPVYFTDTIVRYGMYGTNQVFPGSIDLKHCDIKVDGATRWEAVTIKEMYV